MCINDTNILLVKEREKRTNSCNYVRVHQGKTTRRPFKIFLGGILPSQRITKCKEVECEFPLYLVVFERTNAGDEGEIRTERWGVVGLWGELPGDDV